MRSLVVARDVGTTAAARAADLDADATGVERVLVRVRVPPPARVERAEKAHAEIPLRSRWR